MNTTALKRFAQSARRKLMDQVAAKMEFVLTTDSAELREKAKQINELKKELSRTTREQLVERVAYTWFNRLAALRFMDANDYQPSGIRVVSPAEGTILPQLLNEAKQGNLPDDWKVDAQKVYGLLQGRLPASNPQNEAYRELLIAACNHLHKVFPFLFEAINDYSELLLPDDLTSDFSIIYDVVTGMPAEDCQQVEVLGWLYQFYISEKKDEVFASKSKVKKEDIPAATQLFTPRWIVEYMVQNTVGKLWLQNRPNSKLRDHMPYYIESAEVSGVEGKGNDDYLEINSPEEITLLDQACGSGHILVYGYELLHLIYEEEGYNPSEIPALILQNNLYGFEIDSRAAQLAGFALLMKARQYHRRIFRKGIQPTILTFTDIDFNEQMQQYVTDILKLSDELFSDLQAMQQATNFGSLMQPKALPQEIAEALHQVNTELKAAGLFNKEILEQLKTALEQLQLLGKRFCCVADNPPYMGGGAMNKELSELVRKNYPDSKADLMACFMESGLAMLHPGGYLGMINQHSWMFLSSYERLREKLIKSTQFDTLLHLGPRTFPEIGGEVVQNASFTFKNDKPQDKSVYLRLVDYSSSEEKRNKTLEAIQNPNCGWFYTASQTDFQKIPGSPIGYWLSEPFISTFAKGEKITNFYERITKGSFTGNNDRFLRFWFELIESSPDWIHYNKAGGRRKWFGLAMHKISQKQELLEYKGAGIGPFKYFGKPHFAWGGLTSGAPSFRYEDKDVGFDDVNPSLIDKKPRLEHLGILNSKIVETILEILNPTLHYQVGDIKSIPIIKIDDSVKPKIEKCIKVSRDDWDSHETSWDFQENGLVNKTGSEKSKEGRNILKEAFKNYQNHWTRQFFQLHQNEEELNRQFTEIYGLQEELTPDVPLEEITILQQELDRKELAKLNKRLKREPGTLKVLNYDEIELPFITKEVIAQFVSYAVGCMFGRYSLEKPGLILANQGETLEDYYEKIKEKEVYANKEEPLLAAEPGKADIKEIPTTPSSFWDKDDVEPRSFIPDDDNVIPVLDDEWFEDDIVGRFKEFLKASFGEQHFDRNLQFVEECLGKDIRRYFARDFYADHVRRYKKRPIYWMFSSPEGTFNALIYMHRYTPDTLSLMLNNYLRTYQEKLRARRQHLEQVQISGTATEKAQALKETERIAKVLMELHDYEHDVLYPLATQRINIDLDDGVLVNYNKFGKAVKAVPGLNDAKTKKKVRGFDWIDVSEIRD